MGEKYENDGGKYNFSLKILWIKPYTNGQLSLFRKQLYPIESTSAAESDIFSGVYFFFKYSLIFPTAATAILGARYLSSADIIGDLYSFSLLQMITSL